MMMTPMREREEKRMKEMGRDKRRKRKGGWRWD